VGRRLTGFEAAPSLGKILGSGRAIAPETEQDSLPQRSSPGILRRQDRSRMRAPHLAFDARSAAATRKARRPGLFRQRPEVGRAVLGRDRAHGMLGQGVMVRLGLTPRFAGTARVHHPQRRSVDAVLLVHDARSGPLPMQRRRDVGGDRYVERHSLIALDGKPPILRHGARRPVGDGM